MKNEQDEIESDDWIDPQLFLKWKKSSSKVSKSTTNVLRYQATLSGSNGTKKEYHVWPIYRDGIINWLDPAGYSLAKSEVGNLDEQYDLQRFDFKLMIKSNSVFVENAFKEL